MSHDPGAAEALRLRAADGPSLAADLRLPAGDTPLTAGAVVCHPHPAYGGDRHNSVVAALFDALPAAGVAALRFDFRPGASGREAGGDVVAALDALAGRVPAGVPLWLVGYSFGADVALGVDDPRPAGWAVIAPPLRFGAPARPAAGDPRPVLAVVPAYDQVNPPEALRAAVAGWPDVTVEVVPGADHMLAGATAPVAALVTAWLTRPPV